MLTAKEREIAAKAADHYPVGMGSAWAVSAAGRIGAESALDAVHQEFLLL